MDLKLGDRAAGIAAGSAMRSVQPAWCLVLTLQQQSTLLLAARGPDGVAKSHPCKDVQRAYRGTVLVQARKGRPLVWGEKGDSFMSLDLIAEERAWSDVQDRFFENHDQLPHHFLMHLLHGAEILGYKHPDQRFRERWMSFYVACCANLGLPPESEAGLDARLCDWNQKEWDD